MATSEKKIAANRANAKKSTGPKTPEGKEKSSMNAMTHGLQSELHVFKLTETVEGFEQLYTEYYEHYVPVNCHEKQLLLSLVKEVIRVDRAEKLLTAAENELMQSMETLGKDALESGKHQGLCTLEKRLNRAVYRRDMIQRSLDQHKEGRFGPRDKGGYGVGPMGPFGPRVWIKPTIKSTSEEEFQKSLHENDYQEFHTDGTDQLQISRMLIFFKCMESFLGHQLYTLQDLAQMPNEAKLEYKTKLERYAPLAWQSAMEEIWGTNHHAVQVFTDARPEQDLRKLLEPFQVDLSKG